jgi:subtilisin family serine protease
MEEFNLEIFDEEGRPVEARVVLVCTDMSGERQEIAGVSDRHGGVCLEVPSMARLEVVFVQAEGFWTLHATEVEDFQTLKLSRLPELDEPAWWLRSLGVDTADADRGSGVTVGVVDAEYCPGPGLEGIGPDDEAERPEEEPGHWLHGEMICRILRDRQPTARAFFSVAPGVDVIFADATGEEGGIDPSLAISAIYKLVAAQSVDVINLSWGESEELTGLRTAIGYARDMGVTVVAACGNDPAEPQPLYPARSPDCIGVGAFGCPGWAPTDTSAGWYDETAKRSRGNLPGFGRIFAWSDCSNGSGMDTIGPGVGILVRRNESEVSYDLSGTSFAAPMVAGALAIALAKDKQYLNMPRTSARTTYARRVLETMCRQTGLPHDREGLGVPTVP